MNIYSNLFKTLNLFLVCGATLLPLGEAQASWDARIESLLDTDPQTLNNLKAHCKLHIEKSASKEKWKRRLGKLEILDIAPIRTIDGLKEHLRDDHLTKTMRKDREVIAADKGLKLAQEVNIFGVTRDAFENLATQGKIKVGNDKIPASTLINHSFINVSRQIKALEDFNSEHANLPNFQHIVDANKALLKDLKALQLNGIAEYSDGADLKKLLDPAIHSPVKAKFKKPVATPPAKPASRPMPPKPSQVLALSEDLDVLLASLEFAESDRERESLLNRIDKLNPGPNADQEPANSSPMPMNVKPSAVKKAQPAPAMKKIANPKATRKK